MTTEYRVRLDREVCEGIFACLVRDDRFVETADGLATFDAAGSPSGGHESEDVVATVTDDLLDDARQAARACPVDAIEVTELASDDAVVEVSDE